ncbi:hypothetical protein EH196_18825 [Bacillus sp. C1-1]|nr:hypothetical protein EH196_18825 [Bacillus sp. C1-1]
MTFVLFITFGMIFITGFGLLVWEKPFKFSYNSLMFVDANSPLKKSWNFFYHLTGGGVSYFFYFWLKDRHSIPKTKLFFSLYLIASIPFSILGLTIALNLVSFLTN